MSCLEDTIQILKERNMMRLSRPLNSNCKSWLKCFRNTILDTPRKFHYQAFSLFHGKFKSEKAIHIIKFILCMFALEEKDQRFNILEDNGTYLSIYFCNGLFHILEYDLNLEKLC
tara:strand:+ start:474 stop:818 length:345 start_codon:yes stop_codon:yes gene_type:complete